MKKILLTLAVFALAVPAMAVNVYLVDNGDGTGDIKYDMTADSPKIRALALTIELDAGVITAVTAGYEGENTGTAAGQQGFGIFPGTIDIVGGAINDAGTPVSPNDLPGAAGTGINTDTVVLEMGSLYVTGKETADTGTLATITVSATCDVTITAEETYRAGVIDENADPAVMTRTGGDAGITLAPSECMKVTHPDYPAWVTAGKPDCWCYERNCRGDSNGKVQGPFWVSALDLDLFRLAFNKLAFQLPAGAECSDYNRAPQGPFQVSALDLDIFRLYFNKLAFQVPSCDATHINLPWLVPAP